MYLLFICRVKVSMQCISYQNCFHVYYRCILLDNVAVLGIEFIIQSLMTWVSRNHPVAILNVFSPAAGFSAAKLDVRIYLRHHWIKKKWAIYKWKLSNKQLKKSTFYRIIYTIYTWNPWDHSFLFKLMIMAISSSQSSIQSSSVPVI